MSIKRSPRDALRTSTICAIVTLIIGGTAVADSAKPAGDIRLLRPSQYETIIADAFGPTIKLGGRFEQGPRVDGLFELGAAQMSVSAAAMDKFDVMARAVADQVVNEENRRLFLPCNPRKEALPDTACASAAIEKIGSVLFRRPLSKQEVAQQAQLADAAAQTVGSFYKGLAVVLASMLESPEFLFRIEEVEPDPDKPGNVRLTAQAKATRLSFFLWNADPDEELTRSVVDGSIHKEKIFQRQVDRMVASPRFKDGLQAFFEDMLRLADMNDVSKDPLIYPKFSVQVASAAREQTLRTILDVVLTPGGDYRDIFTTRKTYLNPLLASLYQVPLAMNVPGGSPDYWAPYEFPEGDARAGVLSHISFTSLYSHSGRSSATLRGKALREVILCQIVPSPPAAVDFKIVQDTSNPLFKTARQRLTAHQANPVCAGCHKLTDPIGLALENFSGDGSFRKDENGAPIDTTGELDGVKFSNATDLGRAVHQNKAATSCFVDRLVSYGLGNKPTAAQKEWVEKLNEDFKAANFSVPKLVRELALDPKFIEPKSE